jgi:hypothetical protein
MAGRLTVSTLNNDTGPLSVQNGMTGICKVWVRYNGATQTILGSFNVSSITRIAAGDYTINFSTALSNVNYAITGTGGNWNTTNNWIQANPASYTTSSVEIANVSASGAQETTNLQVAIFGI